MSSHHLQFRRLANNPYASPVYHLLEILRPLVDVLSSLHPNLFIGAYYKVDWLLLLLLIDPANRLDCASQRPFHVASTSSVQPVGSLDGFKWPTKTCVPVIYRDDVGVGHVRYPTFVTFRGLRIALRIRIPLTDQTDFADPLNIVVLNPLDFKAHVLQDFGHPLRNRSVASVAHRVKTHQFLG